MEKVRVKNSLIKLLIVFAIGLIYYIFVRLTGWKIPCLVYEITGLYCPGCGVTRMCVALLQFDLYKAFRCNALVFCALPFVTVFGLRHWLRWVKIGKYKFDILEHILVTAALVLTVVFTILRNLEMFSFLAPC